MQPTGRINIRVYKRLPVGTILIWNTQGLTDDQRRDFQVYVHKLTDNTWTQPVLGKPDVAKMGSVLDSNTDTTMIMHDDAIGEDTPFIVKITFGKMEVREASVKVAGRNSHIPFLKPIRTRSGTYALPVVIVDDLRGGTPFPDQPLVKDEE